MKALIVAAALFCQEGGVDEPDRWFPSEVERRDRARDLWPVPPDPRGLRDGSDLLAGDFLKAILSLLREPSGLTDFRPRRFGPPPRLPYHREFDRPRR